MNKDPWVDDCHPLGHPGVRFWRGEGTARDTEVEPHIFHSLCCPDPPAWFSPVRCGCWGWQQSLADPTAPGSLHRDCPASLSCQAAQSGLFPGSESSSHLPQCAPGICRRGPRALLFGGPGSLGWLLVPLVTNSSSPKPVAFHWHMAPSNSRGIW